MKELKEHIHDNGNSLDYVMVGDYYIPDLKPPEESRPIGRCSRMHKAYLEESTSRPVQRPYFVREAVPCVAEKDDKPLTTTGSLILKTGTILFFKFTAMAIEERQCLTDP